MSFKDEIDRLKKKVEACELNILVWGPGKGSSEHYEKREKIRQEIRTCFYNADVQFSEDLDSSVLFPGIDEFDYPSQELWHLAACDVCVVLDASSGSAQEIAYFVRSQLAYKLLILTHENYKSSTSFPAALRRHQNQLFYTNQQYDSCNLIEYVLDRIRIVALSKTYGIRA